MAARRVELLAVVLVAASWALWQIPSGANQTAHLATVVSLSEGSSNIDAHRNWTGDTAFVDGHTYAAKAPGLALWTTPYYVVLEHLGLTPEPPAADVPFPQAQQAMPQTLLWEMALWGSVLPGLVLLLLVRATVDRIVPGFGTRSAVVLGTAGILAVMATMYFAHTLSACLGFAAFACLFLRRSSVGAALGAGVLAGLAVTVELPLALAAVALGGYALWRSGSAACATYSAGVLAGLLPLLAFDAWAFGSPFTLAYAHAVVVPGVSGHDVMGQNTSGFFGVGLPSWSGALDLLFSSYGLLVLAPVWAIAAYGLLLLFHTSFRPEAALVGAVGAAFLLYNSGYKDLYGAMTAGPRFLAPVLPFFAIPLAAAWRRLPVTTTVVLVVSVIETWILLAGNPMAGAEDIGSYLTRLTQGASGRASSLSGTILGGFLPFGARGDLLVVLLVVVVGSVLVLWSGEPRVRRTDVELAVAALLAWCILARSSSALYKFDVANGGNTGAAATGLAVLAVVVTVAAFGRGRLLALPGLVLTMLLWVRVGGSPRAAAALSFVALAWSVVVLLLARRRRLARI